VTKNETHQGKELRALLARRIAILDGACNRFKPGPTLPLATAELKAEQEKERQAFAAGKKDADLLPIAEARARSEKTDWSQLLHLPVPPHGLHIWDNIGLRELASYIDWSPFFWTWELKGKFPDILHSEKYGQQARELHADALRLLEDIITNHRVQPRAVTAIARAFSDGDDIHIQHSHNGSTDTLTFHFLRQQARKERDDRPYVSLADFVPPEHADAPGLLGGFALTAGHEIEDYAAHHRNKGDDYTAILI
jgi:5-methyltetrahydrofolate--homocysteine methyltransferase